MWAELRTNQRCCFRESAASVLAWDGSARRTAGLSAWPVGGEDGVSHGVEPVSGPVERLADRVTFAAHTEALHESPGSVVGEKAVRDDAVHAEVGEAVREKAK